MIETESTGEMLTRTQVGRAYADLDPDAEWDSYYPVVEITNGDVVGIVTGLLDAHGQPDSDDYTIIDIVDGRVSTAGEGCCDAAALTSDLALPEPESDPDYDARTRRLDEAQTRLNQAAPNRRMSQN